MGTSALSAGNMIFAALQLPLKAVLLHNCMCRNDSEQRDSSERLEALFKGRTTKIACGLGEGVGGKTTFQSDKSISLRWQKYAVM